MTPYTKDITLTTTGTNQVVAIDFPGRCTIHEIAVLNLNATEVSDASFYSRAFQTPAVSVASISEISDDRVGIVLNDWLPLRVGDVIDLTADGGRYQGEYRVVSVVDSPNPNPSALAPVRSIVVDVTSSMTSESASISVSDSLEVNVRATVQVVVPEAERILYRVCNLASETPGVLVTDGSFQFHNQDPPLKRNIGVPRKLYVMFPTAGDYRVVLRASEGIGMGG